MNDSTNPRPAISRSSAGASGRVLRRAIRVIGLAGLMLMGSVVLAASAFAHHAEVTAQVDCNGNVNYTATAWEGYPDDPNTPENEYELSRSNPRIGVWYSVDGGASFASVTENSFTPENGYTFSGSFTLSQPLPETVIVKVQALANWGNGQGPGGPRQTSALPVPECPQPNPSARISDASCSSNGVTISFSNTGAASAEFTVKKDGEVIDTVTVEAGGQATREYSLEEDETATFRVQSSGMEDVVRTVTLDCKQPQPAPAARIEVSCARGGAIIGFANRGDAPAEFTVLKDGVVIDTVTVEAGGRAGRTYRMDEDEQATFTVRSSGMEDVSRTVTLDCEAPPSPEPAASLTYSCEDGVVATFTNTGDASAEFEVLKDGSVIDTVTVGPGEEVTRSYAMDEDEKATFKVMSDGATLAQLTVKNDCAAPTQSPPPPSENPPPSGTTPPAESTAPVPLAFTGVSLAPLGLAMMLLGLGVGLLWLTRRRSASSAY